MKDFLLEYGAPIIYLLEFVAAVSGTLYLRKTANLTYKPFVLYLWFTFFMEICSRFTRLFRDNYDAEWFLYLKNSMFCYNVWFFNIREYVAVVIIGVFYLKLTPKVAHKTLIRALVMIYTVCTVSYFITNPDAFFMWDVLYNFLFSTVAVFLFALLYFIELLQSDSLLQFYKVPVFYISIGLMFWYSCAIPFLVYYSHVNNGINIDFVEFADQLLVVINLITYSCFIFGFLYNSITYKAKHSDDIKTLKGIL